MNITSLYIVILNDDGPRALDQRTVKEPSSKTLRRPAERVLTLNCFSFGGNYYKITDGVALATKVGPSYANLPEGFIENHFFSQDLGPKPEFYGSYINDFIGATTSTRKKLTQFITAINSFHLALKHTWEISDTSLAFLDIKISIEGNGLCTGVYYKPTDTHSPVTCCIHLRIHHTSSTLYIFTVS